MDSQTHPPHPEPSSNTPAAAPQSDRALARLATRQHGVVALWQLIPIGLTPSAVRARVTAGRLHRIHRSVYAVGHRNRSRHSRWMAAVQAHGAAALLSHWDALVLWGCGRWLGAPFM